MDDQEYEYDGTTWKPCATEGSGNCFFHAAFGVREDDTHLYVDKYVNFRRFYWSVFLRYFENAVRPPPLVDFLGRCFVANSKHIEEYDEYVLLVACQDHWVLVEEIPILATIDNIKIVLFIPDKTKPLIFEPKNELLGNFPFRCISEYREVVMRLQNFHYERLISCRQQTEKEVLEVEVAGAKNMDVPMYVPNKRYPKNGSAGVQGGLYQIKLLTVLLLKGMTLKTDWHLSTENSLAGNKYDDAVFGLPQGYVLIQAKHKENDMEKISYEALLQSAYDHPLNIAKYFMAFQEIRKKFTLKHLVISTNAGMGTDKRLDAIIKDEIVDTDHILYFKNSTNVCYSLKETVVPLLKEEVKKHYIKNKKIRVKMCICDEDIRSFLSLLRIFTNFLDDENWEKIAVEAVSQIELAKDLDSMQTFEYVREQVSNWFQEISRSSIYMRIYEAKALFCNVYSLKCVDTFKQYDISWDKNILHPSFCPQQKKVKKSGKNRGNFNVLVDQGKQILHVIPQQAHILSVVKIFQALQKKTDICRVLFLSNSESSMVQEHIVVAFAIPNYLYLVIVSPRMVNRELVQRVRLILRENPYKKAIVIADEDNEFAKALKLEPISFLNLRDEITFAHLSAETATNIQKKNIVFQGKVMNLEDVIDVNAFNETVDGNMLMRLSKRGESIVVGEGVKHSDEDITRYYIYRKFNREEQISEEQMQQSEERVVLISDTAGMGKSTVLDNLAIAVKKTHPHLWVIRVELNSYSRILRQRLKHRKIDLLQLLNSQETTKLNSEFENRLFHVKDKVVLMMDGMDEVSPGYIDMVVDMLGDCKALKNIRKIFLTTRPHLCKALETILEVTAYNLEPFSKDDQEDFLTKYWIKHLGIYEEDVEKNERCLCYAKVLIKKMTDWIDEKSEDTFAGIPLQTRMLAEVFQERTSIKNEEWQRCKEFLFSDENQPNLPNRINLIQLYDMFIEKKRDIFVHDKGKANDLSQLVLIDKFNECCSIYQVLALEVLFHPFQCEFFSIYENRQKNFSIATVEYLLRIGIVQYKDGEPHFIHRTFAEYYAAECLLAELKLVTINPQLKNFFLTEILLRDEYYVIRTFLDNFIDRDLPNWSDASLEAFGLVDYAAIYSLTRSTFLHIVAREGNVGFLRFFLTCAYFAIRGSRERDIDDRVLVDIIDFYLATPLHQAATRGHLIIVKELVENWATIDVTDADGNTPLHAAALGGHMDVVEFLVRKGATTSIINNYGETATHLAAQEGHLNVFTFLMQQVAAAQDAIGDTPALLLAAYRGHLNIIKFIIEESVIDINTTDSTGSTALHAAAHERHLNIVEYLLRKGADATFVNTFNRSPFDDAIHGSNLQLALVLLKHVGELIMREVRGVVYVFDIGNLDDELLMYIITEIHRRYYNNVIEDSDEGSNNDEADNNSDSDDNSLSSREDNEEDNDKGSNNDEANNNSDSDDEAKFSSKDNDDNDDEVDKDVDNLDGLGISDKVVSDTVN